MTSSILDNDDDMDWEQQLASMPMPTPTTLRLPPLPPPPPPPPFLSPHRPHPSHPPFNRASVRPTLPPLSIQQLLRGWQQTGREWKARQQLSNEPGELLCTLVEALVAEVETDSDAAVASGVQRESDYRQQLERQAEHNRDGGDDGRDVRGLLLRQLCIAYHGLMQLLQLQPSPLTPAASAGSSQPAVRLSVSHLAFLMASAHNLSILASQLPRQPCALFFSHFSIALMTLQTGDAASSASSPPLRYSFLFLLSLLDEQAGRSRGATQAVYAQAMLRVLEQMRQRQLMRGDDADAQQHGSADDTMTLEEVLLLQARMYDVAGKRHFIAQQGSCGGDVAEETFELEQRLSRLLLSRRWPEGLCQQLIHIALRLRFPTLALPVLQRLLGFSCPTPHRAQLFCALASDSQLCILCSSLLSAAASAHSASPVSSAAFRCLAVDCHARGVKAARLLQWGDAERLMSIALQSLRHCAQQDGAGSAGRAAKMDSKLTAEMQQQLELVQQRRAAETSSSAASLLSV